MADELKQQPKAQPDEAPKNNSSEISSWLDKVNKARQKRDQRSAKFRWKEILAEFKGDWSATLGYLDIGILPINLVFAYVKTELPSLYIRDPHIKINPKTRTSVWTARVLEAVINYIWSRKRLKREIKKCIVDALLIGHSWFKTGYVGQFADVEHEGDKIPQVINEDYFGYRVPWDCIVFDDDAIDPPYDCAWIAHDIYKTPEELKGNQKYNQQAVIDAHVGFERAALDRDADRAKSGKIRITEIWDFAKKVKFTISDGATDYLEAPDKWPYEMHNSPFSLLKFNFANDDPWGLGDAQMAEPQFLELIKIRSAAVDHLKRFNRQLFAEVDAFATNDEESKFATGTTGAIIKLNPGAIAGNKIKVSDFAQLDPNIYTIEDRVKDDGANVLGQTAAERGGQQKTSTRTIRELLQQVKGAENRRSEKIDSVEDFVEEIAGNLCALIKQFATEPYYVRILGQNSPELQKAIQERPSAQSQDAVTQEGGFTFTQEDIDGEYDVDVVSGSSTPLDRGEIVKTLIQVIEILPQTGAIPGGPIYGAIARMIGEEFDMPELLMAIEQEVEMQAQMKKQQQQQQQDAQDMQTAQVATETQLKAEQAAAKHNKVMVDFIRAQNEAKAAKEASKVSEAE
jgi:hypothetical protein